MTSRTWTALRSSLDAVRAAPRAVAASPAYPWVSGAALTCAAYVSVERTPDTSPLDMAMAVVATAALMWRRTRPAVAVVAVLAALASILFWREVFATSAVAGLIGFYTLARNRVLPSSVLHVAALASAGVLQSSHLLAFGFQMPSMNQAYWVTYYTEFFVLAASMVTAVSIGDAVGSQEERADARALLIAVERRRAADAERAAIARELHDVVSHSVSMIAVQAESATYTTPGLPPEGREALQLIAGTARDSLHELRHLLNVLRKDGEQKSGSAPQPTLERLDDLLEQHRTVGGSAELRAEDGIPVLLPSVEMSVYRVVQEALTNARRHAPGAHTVVVLARRPDRLLLRITDDGPGPPKGCPAGGHGLIGMRERVTLLGGELSTGPGARGGFLIEAWFPLLPLSEEPGEVGGVNGAGRRRAGYGAAPW
ncbi:histidine kinase [Streptomyces sp. NPDC047108]|uniref:sensor histidine kinase n=1 Tax=Streptomyces sp. NPDC047108 TaxID=3155025 RepID=UPI0033CE38F6